MSTPIIINQLVNDTIEVANKLKNKGEKMDYDQMVAVRELVVVFNKELHGLLNTIED